MGWGVHLCWEPRWQICWGLEVALVLGEDLTQILAQGVAMWGRDYLQALAGLKD